MTHIWFDPRQQRHDPQTELQNGAFVPHAEHCGRMDNALAALGPTAPPRDFGMGPLERVHDPDYLAFLQSAFSEWKAAKRPGDAAAYAWPVVRRRALNLSRIDAQLGRYSFDGGTPICEGTWDAAYWAAQVALTGMDALLSGAHRSGLALCRPPGHHSGTDYLGGYCYLSNAAIAAQYARDKGKNRVAILDVDYHHGNGTQDIFYGRDDVFFASIHADPATDYPYYWGHADETGEEAGEGSTANWPLPRGTTLAEYQRALDELLQRISAFAPDILVVSFGADTFQDDPISHFALTTTDYPVLAGEIAQLALPTLVVMEGGYAVDALGDNIKAFMSGF